jgi:predicted ATP-dependent endonuclease of OLD family
MKIEFIEIQNYRKLESVRIDFAKETTLFVGANNSGKTSAMFALRQFLIERNRFNTNDFTLSNWTALNKIGAKWLAEAGKPETKPPELSEWQGFLPALDVWLNVREDEIHHVRHLLPTLDWTSGLLGVRLRLEPKSLSDLYKDFIAAATAARDAMASVAKDGKANKYTVRLWPTDLREFLSRKLRTHFEIRAYLLDQTHCQNPEKGLAKPQALAADAEALEGDPFKGLIKIDQINAQRGFSDAGGAQEGENEASEAGDRRRLSGQLRSYYARHLDPSETPEASDLDALQAIEAAQNIFDERLKVGFAPSLAEVETLNYPGITDPRITIATKINPTDGLNHSAAVQYEVVPGDAGTGADSLRLPEEYNGLGYQNLISIVFRLMGFRDAWMKVGKASKRPLAAGETLDVPPLHLVLIEEPEAHLHAQVQQIFIRRAYQILRKHKDLGEGGTLCTQLVVSTHSSHIAHECEFASLRYFRRLPAAEKGKVPISTVVNLSGVFGPDGEREKFVVRYLKATHCDLFFADAAILVEGSAERMLVPHFIRFHYERVSQAYVTVLEIGGSHAHRFRPLIDSLGLITLIIADLDAADSAGHHPARQPERAKGLITNNVTLRTWLPAIQSIDELLDLAPSIKQMQHDLFFGVRVAYQIPVKAVLVNGADAVEVIANTFEDALAYENLALFKGLDGTGMIAKFKEALTAKTNAPELGAELFEILRVGNKAEFALELLFIEDPKLLNVPAYIHEGLTWLQAELSRKDTEEIAQIKAVAGV